MTRWKITCIQCEVEFGNPQRNYEAMAVQLSRAAQKRPDVIVLPELWTIGYDLKRLDEIADPEAQRMKAFLANAARKHQIHLIGGSTARRTPQGVYNTLLAYDRQGNPVLQYDKVHLFKLMNEHLHLQPGQEKGLFQLEDISCAGVICYDLRFPEWIRLHASAGAEVLFVTAEWPMARLAHWRALLIARAIENQCWVVGCNRRGSDPDHVFAGHSMIVNPWGEVVAEAGENDEFLTAEIDTEEVMQAREQIPVFEDRRPDLYR
ncbi:carbon-nitrogen hydrolase [Saccharibacillus sp. O16]|nr:carbon-nitrogen hydrolase [Saccharibacillus sp. O16]